MIDILHSGCSVAGGDDDVEEVVYQEGDNKLQDIGLHSGCSMAGGEGDVEEVEYQEGENKLQDSNNNNNNNILY